jgi:alkylhydroperoxidase family enzyme
MAKLPDPRPHASPVTRKEMERMAAVRSHAEGRAALGEVYVAMFNNPEIARRVGELGEQIRFHGSLPDEVREISILRYAGRRRLAYEWAHHVHPARLAGVSEEAIAALAKPEPPDGLEPVQRAAVEAVDSVVAGGEIPAATQRTLVDAVGEAGVVDLVALCGLYALMGYMTGAFAIEIEPGLPEPPFDRGGSRAT